MRMVPAVRAQRSLRSMLCVIVVHNIVKVHSLQIVTPQPANPLGRPLHICTMIEDGFVQSANLTELSSYRGLGEMTEDGEWIKPLIFSGALGNMRFVKGHDVDAIKLTIGDYLGWTYELHVYPTYSAAVYHLIHGKCDTALGPFNAYTERMQCHARPVSPESWGNVARGCPLYHNPKNSTTTDSFYEAGCCATPLYSHLANGLAVIAEVTEHDPIPDAILESPTPPSAKAYVICKAYVTLQHMFHSPLWRQLT